jgi:hypothetical protein
VPGAPLPGSCFEGSDGDQVDSDGTGAGNDRLDWQSVISQSAEDVTIGNSDSQFGAGGSEETPDSWTFDFGSLGSDKYDIVSGFSAVEPATDDVMLALAFIRASNNGTTHLAFELNQELPGYRTASETHSPENPAREIDVPTRTAGDLLITYSVDPPVVGLCRWGGDEHTGHWLDFAGAVVAGSNCPALPVDLVEAAMNNGGTTAADNYLEDHARALDAKTFAEATLNLTEAYKIINPGVANPCFSFSYMWMHSRSSISITSNQQDYILPADGIDVSSCAVSGTKWEDVDGDGTRDAGDDGLGGWTFFADYDDDGNLDAGEPFDVSAADGTYTITGIKNGQWHIREVGQTDWICMFPSPCDYQLTMNGTTIGGNDFGNFHIDAKIAVDKTVRRGNSGAFVQGPIQAHVGDTVEYQFAVTNPGNIALAVTLSDPKCNAGTISAPSGDTDGDGKLDTTETWIYTCSHLVTPLDADPLHNVVHVDGDDGHGHTPFDEDEADVDILHPDIEVDKLVRVGSSGAFVQGPVAAHVGDTIEYQLVVTNLGDAPLAVNLSDPRCDAGTLSAASGDTDGDGLLDTTETWTYTCSHVVQAGDAQPFVNRVDVTGTDPIGGTDDDFDTADVDPFKPGIQVVKDGPATAYHGDQVTYTFAVTNTGNVPLDGVTVGDDKCPPPNGGPATLDSKSNADGDDLLENPGTDGTSSEVWVFTCTLTIPAHADGEANPVVNTATASGTDPLGQTVTDTDQHSTTVLHPQIHIEKDGPATAQAGQDVGYTLTVTNPGDVAIVGETVKVTDKQCMAPPALVAKTRGGAADPSPATLDPGDTWFYGCKVATHVGDPSPLINKADVCGNDVNGREVCDDDDATTTLTQPKVVVLPETIVSGASKLAGPASCVRKAFKVRVTGRQIASVRITIDGRAVKTFRNAKGTGKRFVLAIDPARYGKGIHRLVARVTYSAKSETRPRTLRMAFERCARQRIQPEFTG